MRIKAALLACISLFWPLATYAQTIPNAPSNLTASATSLFQINLAWSDTSSNEDGFMVERSPDGANFTQIAQVLAGTTNFLNTGLFPNSTYYYRVRAYNAGGNSAYSSVASASTPAVSCSLCVAGWGNNDSGQATPPSTLTGTVAIAGGYFHGLALKSDGLVVGWGDSFYATPPGGLTGVVAITAGLFHSLAIKSDGTVIGWGANINGNITPPVGLSNVVAVAAGYEHSVALKSDGTVVVWGGSSFGQTSVPPGLGGVVAISAGVYHTVALKSDGTVVAWGDNGDGQSTPPVGLSNVVAVAAGGWNSLALKSDGTIIGWGYDGFGETDPPAGTSGVVAISGGGYHSLALKNDSTVLSWGYNVYGQAMTPAGANGAVAIAAGYFDSLLLATHPAAPSGFTVIVVATNEVDLSWSENSSAVDGFDIERAPDAGGIPGTWAQIATSAANVTTYNDTGVVTDVRSWYRVRAYNACSQSPYSIAAAPDILLDDTWASGIRTNQNLPTSSAWWASAGDNLTATNGKMVLTVGVSSVIGITYFTPDTDSPAVQLNVGDTLTVTFNFVFDGVPPVGSSSQGFRIGLFNFADSTLNPKHVIADGFSDSQGNGVQGYALFEKMYGTFADNQPMDIRKRSNLADGSLLGTSGDWASILKSTLNTSQFPGFTNQTPYSLKFVLRRSGLNSLTIIVTWLNINTGATLSESVTDNSASNFSFDGLAFRPQNNSQAPVSNQFTEVKVELASAPIAPLIVTQPQNLTVSSGQDATFTVVPNGTLPLTYQWYYNTNTPVTDATNSTLTIINTQPAAAGSYSVVISNSYGSVTSRMAQLAVTVAPPSIITQPQGMTLVPGQSATFGVVAIGNDPLNYQWYYNSTVLLTNATADTLTLTNIQASDAGSYSVVVSNSIGSVVSSNAVLNVNTNPVAPVFITQPLSVSAWPGDTIGFTAAAVGTQPITYQWKKNGSLIANAANTSYGITNIHALDSATYTVVASNGIGLTTSSPAVLTVFQPAFPGAEGFGATSAGGRSGTVYHVTNLSDSGSGSFRDAVNGSNRTIVFDVSGTIDLGSTLNIRSNNLTIAGQTAPGDGITVRGNLTEVRNARNIIVRFIRCRAGDINCPDFQDDSFHVENGSNIVVDHVSSSWSIDEALSVTFSTNVSVQWCMITESLRNSCHVKGAHGYGSLVRYGGGGITYHHNLYAENTSRNPRGPSDRLRLDFVNNVIYNWSIFAGYNEDDAADNPGGIYTNFANYIGNYLIAGADTTQNPPLVFRAGVPAAFHTHIYQTGNLMDTNKNGVLDGGDRGWSAFGGLFTTEINRLPFPPVNTDAAAAAYARVLSASGASFMRDAVDSRIVSNVMTQTGAIIDSQTQVGGWPTLNSLTAPTDTDQDGMPDFWEKALGLDPNDPADRNGFNSDGYTRLEVYLNWLAGPHARVQTNSFVNVELRRYTAGLQNPTFGVSSPTNGIVTLLGDGHTAQFTPLSGVSGLASFLFTATDGGVSMTGAVSVLVTPANLVWRGDGSGNNWDVTTTANWLDGANVVTFSPGDNVTFSDAGSNSPPINLVGTLVPSSLTVTAAHDYTFGGSGSLGGVMSLVKAGTGRLVLTTSNTFSGGTTVTNGTLLVNNSTGSGTGTGAVTIVNGATLGGTGMIGGPVVMNGNLQPGNNGVGVLTVSSLVVDGEATMQYELGTNSDLTVVAGNLTLGGTINISDVGGFARGVYTLFTYGGTLTYNGVTIGTIPDPSYSYTIDTNTAGQVNLDVVPLPSTITVVAGDLQDRFGSLMPTSGVAALVVDTGTNGFVDPQSTFALNLGAAWGTDDKIVGLWDLAVSFSDFWGQPGGLFDQTVVAYTNGIAQGQKLRLYWFPDLTLASNTVGVTYYGKYTDTNSPPLNGSAPWNMPAPGSAVELDFYTQSEGGSNPDAIGRATNLTASPPVDPFVAWQTQYFGSANNPAAAPNADPDGDGQNNEAEFLSGSDPTNSASAFRIISVTQQTTNIVVTWRTVGGKTNSLQATSGDTGGGYNTNGFTDVGGQIVIPGLAEILTNQTDSSGATNSPARYYRVRLVP